MSASPRQLNTVAAVFRRSRVAALAGLMWLAVAAIAALASAATTTLEVGAVEALAADRLPARAVREDLAQLYSTLREAHYDVFAHRSRTEYDRLYREMQSSITAPLTRLAAAKLMQRFLA